MNEVIWSIYMSILYWGDEPDQLYVFIMNGKPCLCWAAHSGLYSKEQGLAEWFDSIKYIGMSGYERND